MMTTSEIVEMLAKSNIFFYRTQLIKEIFQ